MMNTYTKMIFAPFIFFIWPKKGWETATRAAGHLLDADHRVAGGLERLELLLQPPLLAAPGDELGYLKNTTFWRI